MSWNVPLWSCGLGKRSVTAELDQSTGISDNLSSLFMAEVTNKAACHEFVIFQTKMIERVKKFELTNKILDFFF